MAKEIVSRGYSLSRRIALVLGVLSVLYLCAVGTYYSRVFPPRPKTSSSVSLSSEDRPTIIPHSSSTAPKHTWRNVKVSSYTEIKSIVGTDQDPGHTFSLDKVRLCFIVNELEDIVKSGGGIGTAYASLLGLASEEGYEVTVLMTCMLGDAEFREAKIKLSIMGATLAPRLQHQTVAGCGWQCNHGYSIMRWLLEQAQPFDVVHMHDYLGYGYFPMLAKRQGLGMQGTQFVVTAHGTMAWALYANGKWMHKPDDIETVYMERQMVRLTDYLVSPSQYMLHWMLEEGWKLASNAYVHPNMLPSHKLRILHEKTDGGGVMGSSRMGVSEVVFFGRIETRKGVPLFMQGVEMARTMIIQEHDGSHMDRIAFNVTLLGRLDYVNHVMAKRWLDERASKWPLPPKVMSSLSRDDALRYLTQEGRLVVIPSAVENSPYTVLECLELGIPFIASDLSGIRELIHEDDADHVLFKPNPKSFSSFLLKVLRDGAMVARPRMSAPAARDGWSAFHRLVANKALQAQEAGQDLRRDIQLPLVSVVITHYNRPHLLRQALDSMHAQTYSPLEVIVVDDASSSTVGEVNMGEYFAELEASFARDGWRLVRHQGESLYVGGARNLGATYAQGEYIMFMDEDNYAKPEEIATFVKAALGSGSALLTCFVDYFHGVDPPPDPSRHLHPPSYMFLGNALELGIQKNVLGDANMFVRRTAFTAVGGFSTEQGLAFEDWQFMVAASLHGYEVEVVPLALFWKRSMYGEKTMMQYGQEGLSQYLSYRQVLSPYLELVQPPELRYTLMHMQHLLMHTKTRVPNYDEPFMLKQVSAQFGNHVILLAYGMPSTPQRPGSSFILDLHWKCVAPTVYAYAAFVHLKDESGKVVCSADGVPRDGNGIPVRTNEWLPQEVMEDQRRINIPSDIQQGTYSLHIGWYRQDVKTGDRLPLVVDGRVDPRGDYTCPEHVTILPKG